MTCLLDALRCPLSSSAALCAVSGPSGLEKITVRLVGYAHVISCRAVAQVRRWSNTGELAKLAAEVRLIEIDGREGNIRPIALRIRVDAPQDASEPGEPDK